MRSVDRFVVKINFEDSCSTKKKRLDWDHKIFYFRSFINFSTMIDKGFNSPALVSFQVFLLLTLLGASNQPSRKCPMLLR